MPFIRYEQLLQAVHKFPGLPADGPGMGKGTSRPMQLTDHASLQTRLLSEMYSKHSVDQKLPSYSFQVQMHTVMKPPRSGGLH